jgi:hypothetical protein
MKKLSVAIDGMPDVWVYETADANPGPAAIETPVQALYDRTEKLYSTVEAIPAAVVAPIVYPVAQSVTTDESGIPTACGAVYIDSADWTVAPVTITWRAILESSAAGAGQIAYVDLYDVEGVLYSAVPGVVVGSEMDNSIAADQTVATVVEVDLTSELEVLSGGGVFEARVWIDTPDGVNSVACKSAVVIVEFELGGGGS